MKMHMKSVVLALGATMLAGGTLLAGQAWAVEITKYLSNPGADCSLSIPTTDTAVRPKAFGLRNEGTTNAFVICTFPNVRNLAPTAITLDMESFDGAAHSVKCTYATRYNLDYASSPPLYLTRTYDVPATGGLGQIVITNGTDMEIRRFTTVTCILPAGVTIMGTQAVYNDGVGA